MASTNSKSIARRIAKLEVLLQGPQLDYRRGWQWRPHTSQPSLRVRLGNLRRLPEDYQGERHIEIAQWLPETDGQEWVEFVEVPGPSPSGQPSAPWHPTGIDVIFVEAYPTRDS